MKRNPLTFESYRRNQNRTRRTCKETERRSESEIKAMLHEIAYVLHLTRRISAEINQEHEQELGMQQAEPVGV